VDPGSVCWSRREWGWRSWGRSVWEIMGSGSAMERLWYNLKYDRNLLMTVKGDMDVKTMFK